MPSPHVGFVWWSFLGILGLLLGISPSYRSRFRFGGRIEQSQIKTHAPVRTVTRTVSIIFPADLKADRLFSNLQDLADLEDERHGPLRVARDIVPVCGGFRRNSESRVRLCCVSQERLEKHLAKALPALLDSDGPELIHEYTRG